MANTDITPKYIEFFNIILNELWIIKRRLVKSRVDLLAKDRFQIIEHPPDISNQNITN